MNWAVYLSLIAIAFLPITCRGDVKKCLKRTIGMDNVASWTEVDAKESIKDGGTFAIEFDDGDLVLFLAACSGGTPQTSGYLEIKISEPSDKVAGKMEVIKHVKKEAAPGQVAVGAASFRAIGGFRYIVEINAHGGMNIYKGDKLGATIEWGFIRP